MTRLLWRRVASGVATLFAVSVLSFALLEMAPGDFFGDLRADPQVGAETADALRARYGLNDGPVGRYWRWLQSFVSGDLGTSLSQRASVSSVLWVRAGNTLLLTIPALLLTWAIALPLGILAASRRNGLLDRMCAGASSTLVALPDLLVALLVLLLALGTGWFPAGGMFSARSDDAHTLARARDFAAHVFLPLTALSATTLPAVFRHIRASVIEAGASPAVVAARGHGIRGWRLVTRYVLPLAANPLVSMAGLSIAALLSGSLLIEVVMSWPGLGPLLLDAILARDVHVVLSASMLATALLVTANLAADLTLARIDPRIRS